MSKKQNAVQRNWRRFKRGLKHKQQFNQRRDTTGSSWKKVEKSNEWEEYYKPVNKISYNKP
jgi:hypothetical protein